MSSTTTSPSTAVKPRAGLPALAAPADRERKTVDVRGLLAASACAAAVSTPPCPTPAQDSR